VPRRPRVRAVLDSNLLVRGLLRRRRSSAVALLDAVSDGRLRLVTSDYLLAEVDRVLREPEVRVLRSLSDAQIDAFLGLLRNLADVVAGTYELDVVPGDPADNPVLACAVEADARFVVTDDRRHLLPLKVLRLRGHRAVQIVSPTDFLRHHLPRKRRRTER